MTAYASYVYYRDEWCGTLAKEDYDRLSKRAQPLSRYADDAEDSGRVGI